MAITLNVPLPILSYDASRPAEFIDPRGASEVKNMRFSRFELKKRYGTDALGASLAERIQALFEVNVGGSYLCLRTGNTKFQQLNKSTGAWADKHHAVLTGTDSNRISWAFPLSSGARVVVYTNGADGIRLYTGTGNDSDLGGSPPLCKYMVAFGGYLLLAGIQNYSQRVQWCDTGDITNWSTGNAGSEDLLEDQEDITGIAMLGRYVTVHKSNSIYVGQVVSTSDVFQFDRKATGYGALCHWTIQELPTGEQIFLAKDGIRIFNGITAPLIDAPLNDEIREEMNPQYASKAWSVVRSDLNEYWVAVPIGSQTEPNTIYKYNWATGQVYKDERSNISACNVYIDSNDITIDDLTGTIDSQTWRLNDVSMNSLNPIAIYGNSAGVTTNDDTTLNDDNSVAIDAYFQTKDFTAQDFGIKDYGMLMRWKGIENWLKGDTVVLDYSIDSGVTWTNIATLTLSSQYPSDSSPLWGWFDVVSTKIRFRWRNKLSGESFAMKKFSIHAIKRGMRK